MGLIVKATLDGVTDRNNWVATFMRILINHIHLVLLTSSFNFNWNKYLRKFLAGFEPVAEASTFIFAIDCFYNDEAYGKVNEDYFFRLFFQKILLYAVLPFVMFALCFFIWSVIKIIRCYHRFPTG